MAGKTERQVSMELASRSRTLDPQVAPPMREMLTACFAALLILSLFGPFMTFNGLPSMGEGSPLRQALFVILLVMLIIAVKPLAQPRRLLTVPLLITIALGWCWLSLAWAIEPGIAVRRLILASVIIWSIFLAVRELGYERSVMVVRVVLAAALIANYAAVFLWPEVGTHVSNEVDERTLIGDWRGIMMHKNIAGPVCVVTLYAFLFDARRINIWVRAAVIAGAGWFLFKSGSKTSFGLGLTGIAVGFLFLQYNFRYRAVAMILMTALGCAGTILSMIYRNPLLGNLTDPKSFTGRPLIWKVLTDYIADNPLLGSGYGSFWAIGPNAPVFHQATGWITTISTGHNGYLDLAAQIGVPAMLFTVAAVLIIPLAKMFASPATTNQRGALIVSIIFFSIGANFTESSLFDRDGVTQVFLMVAVALGGVLLAQPVRRALPSMFTPASGRPRVAL